MKTSMLFDVGRVCVKVAGRDAGQRGVIVEILDSHFVLLDGATRRRKVNVNHLEPLDEILALRKGASHEEVSEVFTKKGWKARNTTPKQPSMKPQRNRKSIKRVVAVEEKKEVVEKKEKKTKKAKEAKKDGADASATAESR